jgi:hypothetical protein
MSRRHRSCGRVGDRGCAARRRARGHKRAGLRPIAWGQGGERTWTRTRARTGCTGCRPAKELWLARYARSGLTGIAPPGLVVSGTFMWTASTLFVLLTPRLDAEAKSGAVWLWGDSSGEA